MSDLTPPSSEEEAAENRAKLVGSKTAWKKAGVHTGVVLPSGFVISVKIPNLPALAESGSIPNELVDLAVAMQGDDPPPVDSDALTKLSELQSFLVSKTVVEPAITPDEVSDLPAEDLQFIIEIAYRQRDVDALGNQISGLDKLAKYATFRDVSYGDEALLDA